MARPPARRTACGREERVDRRRSRTRPRSPEPRRSASPAVDTRDPKRRRHSRHGRENTKADTKAEDVSLPYAARPLVRTDLQTLEPLFVHYLKLQKRKDARDMDEREFRGRWKSFVGKWNRNELAEGWYDPELLARISTWASEDEGEGEGEGWEAPRRDSAGRCGDAVRVGDERDGPTTADGGGDDDDDDDDDYGPRLPRSHAPRRKGAKIPSMQDLTTRDELIQGCREAERQALRNARKADRALQKQRLEELAPRAEAGTRERRLEKRREVNDKMRQFRDKSPGMEAGNDKDLMGGGDSVEEYRRMKATERRRKSERQIKKEEYERAEREIMEAKRRAWQQREEGTVSMLQELARRRFG